MQKIAALIIIFPIILIPAILIYLESKVQKHLKPEYRYVNTKNRAKFIFSKYEFMDDEGVKYNKKCLVVLYSGLVYLFLLVCFFIINDKYHFI